MLFLRVKSEGIAQNSYFLGSESEAVVIDPRRDCKVYLDVARASGMRITGIFETHRNEDYATGSRELERVTGAGIYHGPGLEWGFGSTLAGGEVFEVGKLRLTAIHTPGHTPESLSYAVVDTESGDATVMVFTGDTLFVNEVGRCDLLGREALSGLAESMHDSLHRRLLPLGDGVILCPAHGGGSVCGARIAVRDESTLGTERLQNPVLRLERKDFLDHKLSERLEVPPYFRMMEKYNLEGPPLLGRLPLPRPMSSAEFQAEMGKGAVLIDASCPAAFGGCHIQGAYSIWLEGLPVFAGWVLPYDRPLLLVPESDGDIEAAARYLVRCGYDRISGYLKGGVEAWYNAGLPVERLPLMTAAEVKQALDKREGLLVLDVRSDAEWDAGHIDGATHIYVGYLEGRLSELPRDRSIAVHCSVGHRSGLACSILLRAGFERVSNVIGGMTAWQNAGFGVVGG